jgi:hypothetical protein
LTAHLLALSGGPSKSFKGAQHEQIVAIRPATERTFTLPQFFNKQPASRWLRDNNISIPGDGASHPSTTFAPSTQQIRVASTLAGWLQIDGSGTAVANTSMYLPANWVDHYSVTPGQVAAFLSTSTSTGTCSVSEVG